MVRSRRHHPAARSHEMYHRALEARDRRFDGVFFVGISTTGIYCRPVCPSRRANPAHRRFFPSAAAAEAAGFRPCLRCRPELAPGRAQVDSVSRLVSAAVERIGAGALNGRSVGSLAADLRVTERHLRRVLRQEMGVSPVELAQTQRLLFAKRLLADTTLSVSRIAFASGFQSLRRFNALFHDRYRMSPSSVRRTSGVAGAAINRPSDRADARPGDSDTDWIRLTLPYREPFACGPLMAMLRREAVPGVEIVQGRRYARTVQMDGGCGVVLAEFSRPGAVRIEVSASLLSGLMLVLARLRRLFDLDAEPDVVDAHLAAGGLGSLVRRRPGIRLPGVFDGFEFALFALLRDTRPGGTPPEIARQIVRDLGEPVDSGIAGLDWLTPTPARVASAGPRTLQALGISGSKAEAVVAVAELVTRGELRLESGTDVHRARRVLAGLDGVGEPLATLITMRALHWPDAFPARDTALQLRYGAPGAAPLRDLAERWRPWRGYAAMHLWLDDLEAGVRLAAIGKIA